MILRYSYNISTHLVFDEHWPTKLGEFDCQWQTNKEGRVEKVIVEVHATGDLVGPTIKKSSDPRIGAEINFGVLIGQEEIEQALRTLQGILSLFANIDVDFTADEVSWVAESPNEAERLKIHSLSRSIARPDANSPRRLGFDLIARAVGAATKFAEYETPLSFLRKGHSDIRSDRYIEAYYSFFFFLETQFFAGYSDPKIIKKKLKETEAVKAVMDEVRQGFHPISPELGPKMPTLLTLDDDRLLDELVGVRGKLHHHSKHGPSSWHPEKQKQFRSEALLISAICHNIAMRHVVPNLFGHEQDTEISQSAVKAGAVTKFLFETSMPNHKAVLETVGIIGKRPTNEMLQTAELRFRGALQSRLAAIDNYQVVSSDKQQVFGIYSRRPISEILASITPAGKTETNS